MTSESNVGEAIVTEISGFSDAMKAWTAANKALLSQAGIDIAMTASDGGAAISGSGKSGSVTVYAQTQSPDLFDETASTDGFVELTARATISADGQWYVEVLNADTAETELEVTRLLSTNDDLEKELAQFIDFLKEHSFHQST